MTVHPADMDVDYIFTDERHQPDLTTADPLLLRRFRDFHFRTYHDGIPSITRPSVPQLPAPMYRLPPLEVADGYGLDECQIICTDSEAAEQLRQAGIPLWTPKLVKPVPEAQLTEDETKDAERIRTAVENAQRIVETEFPGYWPRLEAALSTVAVLRLKFLDNCVVLIFSGPPSVGKSALLDMLRGGLGVVTVDKFTPASFVANTMGKTAKELEDIDLLSKIRLKLMLTRELSGIFRGTTEALQDLFKILTNILDGKGHATATAAHGLRSIVGDCVFVWLGASTPIPQRTWEVQQSLGSRLMFYDLPVNRHQSEEDLLEQRQGKPFREKAEACNAAVQLAIVALLTQRDDTGTVADAVRSVEWGTDPRDVTLWLVRLGKLLAQGRCRKPLSSEEDAFTESPQRNITLLENLARGRAMLQGRRTLNLSDIALPTHVTFSSMQHGSLLRLAAVHHATGLTAAMASKALGIANQTAADRMRMLAARTEIIVEGAWLGAPAQGAPPSVVYHLADEWKWMGGLAPWL